MHDAVPVETAALLAHPSGSEARVRRWSNARSGEHGEHGEHLRYPRTELLDQLNVPA
jgi:hypothetical protein